MKLFTPTRNGHLLNARKFLIEKGLKTSDEVAFMNDYDVEEFINKKSDYVIFQDGDGSALIPKKFEDHIVWINR